MVDLTQDYFTLFGLPRRFRIDESGLDSAYRELQSRVHPDRYAHMPETQRRLSLQWAARVNEAYRALKKPLPRALYLLELAGLDPGHEKNTAMSPEFLTEQMEWREAVATARTEEQSVELERLQQGLREEAAGLVEQMAAAFDDHKDLNEAGELALRLMFLKKLDHDIDLALEALDA